MFQLKSVEIFKYLMLTVSIYLAALLGATSAWAKLEPENPTRTNAGPVFDQQLYSQFGTGKLTKPGQTRSMGGDTPDPQNQEWPTISGKTVKDLYPAGSDPWFDRKNLILKSQIPLPDNVITVANFKIMQGLTTNNSPYPSTGVDYGVTAMKAALLENAMGAEPQRAMHEAEAQRQAQTTQTGDAAADAARGQAASAISFCSSYLQNFTTQPQWNMVRDQIFVPMAILLLLPGAALAQMRAIIAAGSPVLGEVNPFEGILRSIVAIFLIPGTALVVNYGIDLNNSLAYTINSEYSRIFGSDMYKDALCAEMRATPVRQSQSNRNALDQQTYQGKPLLGGNTPFAQFEGMMMENSIQDPCLGINQAPPAGANENMSTGMSATRLMMNGSNASLAAAWNILCAFQLAYLYYLWCVGPIMAALWVYPLRTLRNALPSWTEGVITLCFWSLFWNTVILLMACFKGVDETGTMIMTALNFLATASVKYAFDFAGLVKAAGQEAAGMAQQAASKAGGAGGGHGGGHQAGSRGHGHSGARGGGATGAQVASSERRKTGALAGSSNGDGRRLAAAERSDSSDALIAPRKLADASEGPRPVRSLEESMVAARSFTPFEGKGKLDLKGVTTPPEFKIGSLVDTKADINMGVPQSVASKVIVVAGANGEADFRMLAAAQAREAAGAAVTERSGAAVLLESSGITSRGIDGNGGVDGRGTAGIEGANGAALVVASGNNNGVGWSNTDVLRSAEIGILGAVSAKDVLITPLSEGIIGGKADLDFAGKKSLDELAAAGADPAKASFIGPLLPIGGGPGEFKVPLGLLVGPPPSETTRGGVTGFDANRQPITDLSRLVTDASLVVDNSQTANLTDYDSNLVSQYNSLAATDGDLLQVDNSLLAAYNNLSSDGDLVFNYDSSITGQSALGTTFDTTIDASSAGAVLSYDASTDNNTFIGAVQLTPAQLAAINGTDPNAGAIIPNNGMITTFGRDGLDPTAVSALNVGNTLIHPQTFDASMVNNANAMSINPGDTFIHSAQVVDASSLVHNNANNYSEFSHNNGATRDLIQPTGGGVVDTAMSSTFAMFNRDNSVNTSAVDVWRPDQPGGINAGAIDQTLSSAPITNSTAIDALTNTTAWNTNTNPVESWTNANAWTNNSTAFDSFNSNSTSQFSVDNGSYLMPTSAVQVVQDGNAEIAANPVVANQYERNIDTGSWCGAPIDNSQTQINHQESSTNGTYMANYAPEYPTATFSSNTFEGNPVQTGSSSENNTSVNGGSSYSTANEHYADNSQTYNSAPPANYTDVSGNAQSTADSARYATYSTGGYAADANWTTSYSSPPTVEGENHNIAYNNSFGTEAATVPSRVTDSWFDSGTNNVNTTAAASPMSESPRNNEVIGHSDLGIAMPIVPKQVFASAEPAAPAPVAKAPADPPRTLAMNTTKAVNANKLTAAMGRAAGQTQNNLPAANNRFVGGRNGTGAPNGVVAARTVNGAQPEYARYQPQSPNGNEPPPVLASMPESLQNQLMLGNQRGGRIQKADAEGETTMKLRLDQMTGFNGGRPV